MIKLLILLTLVKLFFNKVLFFIGIVEAQKYEHNAIHYEAKELNDTVGGELLLTLLLFACLLILVLVCYRGVLVIVPDPVHNWATEHGTENHGSEEYTEGERAGTLERQPLDSQYKCWEYQ